MIEGGGNVMTKTKIKQAIHELLSCRTSESIVAAMGGFVKNPVILADMSLHILAVTPDDSISDPRWHGLYAERMMPMNLVNLSLYRDALRTEAPVISTDSTGLPIIRCAVAVHGRLLAYLLSPCYHGAPSQEELDLMQVAADLCSLRLRQEPNDVGAEGRVEHFISALLDGTMTDEQQIRDRCRAFGWRLTTPYRVLTIRGADSTEMTHGAGYLAQTKRCAMLEKRFPGSTVFLYGEQVKLLIGVPEDAAQERLLFRELADVLEENRLIAGVSQAGRNMQSLYDRHRQAMKALQLGILLLGDGPLYRYDRYSIYHALEACDERFDILELCHGAVLKLERYDRKHGTAYMGTLHAYLASGMNARETAQALYIHRNTLAKRLEKMNDLITVDLDDRDTVFHLLFSLRVIEYYGAVHQREDFENWVKRMPTLRHR